MKSLSQREFLDWADQYLRHELAMEDRHRFEVFCRENPDSGLLFKQHEAFVRTLNQVDARAHFKRVLRDTSAMYHHGREAAGKSAGTISVWGKIRIHAAMAAAVAIISVFSTLWLTGYYSSLKKASSDYSALRREVNNVKKNVHAQSAAIKNINSAVVPQEPTHYGATGFLTGTEGYVLTNYHVVRGADSVKLRNHRGQSYLPSTCQFDISGRTAFESGHD